MTTCPRLVEDLEGGYGEDGGLASSGLGLGDDVTSAEERADCALLDCGGAFEAVGVDSAEEFF